VSALLLLLLMLACDKAEVPDTHDSDPPADSDPSAGDTGADTSSGDADTAQSGDDTAQGDTAQSDDTAPEVDTSPPPVYAAICVNEFMPDNESALITEAGDTPDWIELHNPTDAEVSLDGWVLADSVEDGEPLPEGLSIPAAGYLLLYPDEQPELGLEHLGFKLSAEGGEVALLNPSGDGQVIAYGQVSADFAASRTSDCCEEPGCWDFTFRGTPGETNVPPVYVDLELLAAGSEWRFNDQGLALDAAWREPGFDDSGWSAGPAPLGYGDSHQVTTTSYGSDPNNKTITTYFRRTFEVTDAAEVYGLTVSLMLDDGAVVWLNGEEALRVNITSGEVTHDTLATAAVSEPAEYTLYDYAADAGLLVDGANTLAVEVHQATASSSDLTFDMAVTVETLK
jgi:hypothetical protein